ncbi:MAG TPA: MmcQ/YjbR family DNA-binding protein [Solirubrobacteraceae bacterium]|nr:MmcQ/YjbR family DNA-binding protein [Solirubrobacteraceae bacterium]
MATFDDVRELALALPETEEGTRWGNRTWLVKGKGFVWERPLRKSDLQALGPSAPTGAILGARTEHLVAKGAILAENPEVFFTTPHFDNYPAVLIRLDRIAPEELEEIVAEAWLAQAPKRLADAYVRARAGEGLGL